MRLISTVCWTNVTFGWGGRQRKYFGFGVAHMQIIQSVCTIQVLQGHRSPAGPGVYGRGDSLHHLRGGGEAPERCVEDRLKRTRHKSRSVGTSHFRC